MKPCSRKQKKEIKVGIAQRTNGNEASGRSNVHNDSLLLLNHLGEHQLGELGEGHHIDVDELINQGIVELVQKLGVGVAGSDIVHLWEGN